MAVSYERGTPAQNSEHLALAGTFRALSGRLKITFRRHKFNKYFLSLDRDVSTGDSWRADSIAQDDNGRTKVVGTKPSTFGIIRACIYNHGFH